MWWVDEKNLTKAGSRDNLPFNFKHGSTPAGAGVEFFPLDQQFAQKFARKFVYFVHLQTPEILL